jgi:hypothetical protein
MRLALSSFAKAMEDSARGAKKFLALHRYMISIDALK